MFSRSRFPFELQHWKPKHVAFLHYGPALENTDDLSMCRMFQKAPHPIYPTSLFIPFHLARPSSSQDFSTRQVHHLKDDPVVRAAAKNNSRAVQAHE